MTLKVYHFPMIQQEVCHTRSVAVALKSGNTHSPRHLGIEIFQQNAYLNSNCGD